LKEEKYIPRKKIENFELAKLQFNNSSYSISGSDAEELAAYLSNKNVL
jgi:hypothetical protein